MLKGGGGEEITTSAAGNLIEDGFVLDPVFHTESEDDQVVKVVRFGGETIIKAAVAGRRKPEIREKLKLD